ncbi:hypothetical protein MBRA1_002684 [Malassezia brasiliensis]|uniref:Tyrosine-protein phosphatase domain-containing protein n=1 Tax=Malassezia brasiliensis TaxID=1821822 RepID=A0AAF0DTY9_9BASI|nr:hypothetical protein MBRA1_002684 [Malassezia brasiliensis]
MTATGIPMPPLATDTHTVRSERRVASGVSHATADAISRPSVPPVGAGGLPCGAAAPGAPSDTAAWGLHHASLDVYPPLDTSDLSTDTVPVRLASAPPVRGVSAAQFAAMYADYAALDVPHEVLFPYLYCGHHGPTAQTRFFSASGVVPAPAYRGLAVVRVGDECEAAHGDGAPAPARRALLLSSQAPEETLRSVPACGPVEAHDARFRHQPATRRVSTRNFQAQSINYTMVSDVVVYSPAGLTDAARRVALAFRYAQQQYWHERLVERLGGLRYNVFVITEPFDALERACPELVAVDAHGRPRHAVDFLQREQDEMYRMASVSRIDTNVYLGPTRDFRPNIALPQDAPYTGAPTFSIALDAFKGNSPPTPAFLRSAAESFAVFDRDVALGRRVQVPTAHLECPTGALPEQHPDEAAGAARDVLMLCAWLEAHVSPAHCRYPRPARRALIHCADGYTESSVFALAYLMYTQRLRLEQAYLQLQLRVARPFFVFGSDLELLRAVEALVHGAPAHDDWLDDAHFDGSLPSRILPFLYLGNLGHARNARLLRAIGITHVVSVGECVADDDDDDPHSLAAARRAGQIDVHYVANVADDGTDSLRAALCDAVEFVERARVSGGRVLVHCRVGVSRSSTVVIAYAMAHLDITLVDAYLLVRSRRLNVLIQPHLLFFWELRAWEARIAAALGRRAACDPAHAEPPRIVLGAGRGAYGLPYTAYARAGERCVTWSWLCREIAALNARYCVDA